MDENEKMVLRRRRGDIADRLEATRELCKEFSARGLISHDAVREIEVSNDAILILHRLVLGTSTVRLFCYRLLFQLLFSIIGYAVSGVFLHREMSTKMTAAEQKKSADMFRIN
jgi:hypothetical protein